MHPIQLWSSHLPHAAVIQWELLFLYVVTCMHYFFKLSGREFMNVKNGVDPAKYLDGQSQQTNELR